MPGLCIIFACYLPAAGPGGLAANVARTCSLFAELVRSDEFWVAALEMRYRVVPSIDGLATSLGRAPCQHEVYIPAGLAHGPHDSGFRLISPAPLSPSQLRALSSSDCRGGADQVSAVARPAVLLAMTECGPTMVLLERAASGTVVLEFAGDAAPLAAAFGRRSFFGGRHEVWVDVLETQRVPIGRGAGGGGGTAAATAAAERRPPRRRRYSVNAARRGTEARWVRFCRAGEVPNLRLVVAFGDDEENDTITCRRDIGEAIYTCSSSSVPRLFLVAQGDLPAFTELTWSDLHFCSCNGSAAAPTGDDEAPAVGGRHGSQAATAAPTELASMEAEEPRIAPALQELHHLSDLLGAQKRAGAFPGAEGAHVFVSL